MIFFYKTNIIKMIMLYLEFPQNKKLEKLNSSLDVVYICLQMVSGKYYTSGVVAKRR